MLSLTELGLDTRAATVTCDVPWLDCAIVGRSVRLVATAGRKASRQRGSARISSQGRSVMITVDLQVASPPRQTGSAASTGRQEAGWTVARAVTVGLVLGLLLFLAFVIAS
ncbi:hypothetical protein BU204_13090 [Actinophytocola xanthii]|uniref:Uncharacterized protein n=1 Tax=Actinophytocola xanthii TaxID=1912961 RepID=A0A1Q8CRR1_9PSEU|nr:hypothetical protein BU204_13090 [Actinophytocola xanthii]